MAFPIEYAGRQHTGENIRLCSLIVHESRHLHSYNDDTNKVYNKLIVIRCHPLVVIVNTVRCLCLSNYMRACVFRRPRKSLTSPDAEKTSAATQRPAEELRNWQVSYYSGQLLMMAHHTHMLHCFDYILHSSLVERLVMRSFSSDLLNVMCCRSMCIHACTQCHAHMPVYCVCHGAQSSANYNPCTNMRKM